MPGELVFSVHLAEGESPLVDQFEGSGFDITAVPERDPTLVTFLVSFAATAAVDLLVLLRRVAGPSALKLAMRHNGRRLTIDTDDDGLDVEVLAQLMKDFYRDQ